MRRSLGMEVVERTGVFSHVNLHSLTQQQTAAASYAGKTRIRVETNSLRYSDFDLKNNKLGDW